MPNKPKSDEKPTSPKRKQRGVLTPPDEKLHEVPEDGIGSRIRAARETKGISQTALAEYSKEVDPDRKGIHRTVLVGYEAGHSRPGAREIRILCEALNVTPNWLIYGSDFAGGTEQTSMEAARKNGLFAAMRIALAIAVLKPHERNALQSMALSMAGRELGDRKLSGLFMIAAALAAPGFEVLLEKLEDPDLMSKNISEVLDAILAKDGWDTQWGNKLDFGPEGKGPITGEWLYPEPKK